jgi:hypothetical protein
MLVDPWPHNVSHQEKNDEAFISSTFVEVTFKIQN